MEQRQYFDMVREYLHELDIKIVEEDLDGLLFVIEDEDSGISNMMLDCQDPLLIAEQLIMPVPENCDGLFKKLLQMNRELVHGAYVLDAEAKYILFRNTLQLRTLDLGELESTIRALSLGLAEHSTDLLAFANHQA